jgi:hypothetical protein
MSRAARRSIAAAVLATASLALALGIGLPDPGAAERAYGGLLGLLGCLLAVSWLRSTAEGRAPAGRFSSGAAGERDEAPEPPVVEAVRDLERALRLGISTIGTFNRLVQPRLQSLATAKLSRSGIRLDTEAAVELLGDGFRLVDPAAPPPEDRMAPGFSLHEIEGLVETLEQIR